MFILYTCRILWHTVCFLSYLHILEKKKSVCEWFRLHNNFEILQDQKIVDEHVFFC